MRVLERAVWSFFFAILATATALAQQEFVQTVTKENKSCNNGCTVLDIPDLNGNTNAVILATPIVERATPNPHPIGAYFMYLKKWSIYNLDQTPMPEGAKFKVQYWTSPGADQFVFVAPRSVGSCIDRAGLNGNPDVEIRSFATALPGKGSVFNTDPVRARFDPSAGRWCVVNSDDTPVPPGTAYFIVAVSVAANASNPPRPAPEPNPSPVISGTPALAAASTPSATPVAPAALRPPIGRPTTTKSLQLAFDTLNNFPEKGLPPSAPSPSGDLDQAAVNMARQISRSDENSLPVLLAALQTAGFTVIDEKGTPLLKPADGKGQGLAFYDFEAVGALKLANRGVTIPLEKLAAIITKQMPEVSTSQFAEVMLAELRAQQNNSQNAYARFYSRLVIELGRNSPHPVDMATVPTGSIDLSILQASLLTRRLQGTLYALRNKQRPTGLDTRIPAQQSIFVPVSWHPANLTSYRSGCDLTGDQALFLDGSAIELTAWNGLQVSQFGHVPAVDKISKGVGVANVVLAWSKLAASVTMMKGEILVSKPLPLVRTKNSTPGEKRLMIARIWTEVGKKEQLNCLRPIINLATGLDFNLPSEGPLGDVAIEWRFEGENVGPHPFVAFKADEGVQSDPLRQVTNNLGLSRMWLVGSPKIPAVVYQKNPMEVQRKADVLVGVTLKSAKDVRQNLIDILGVVVSGATAVEGGDPWGLLGVLGSTAEIGFRSPFVTARVTVPVTDHAECNGQWFGTVTYTVVNTLSFNTPKPITKDGYTTAEGGYDRSEEVKTWSGTVQVDGENATAASQYDYTLTSESENHGTTVCCPSAAPCGGRTARIPWQHEETLTKFGSGAGAGPVKVFVSLQKDGYKVQTSGAPMTVTGETAAQSSSHLCIGGHPGSYPPKNDNQNYSYVGEAIDLPAGLGEYGSDPNELSGSYTLRSVSGATVTTITWNLRRCNK